MGYSAHDSYLESRVLSADPVELVRLMYQAATGAVRDARRCLAEGDIAARSRAVSKAGEILLELSTSLDFERGGEISVRLAHLYDYMLRKLTEAHFQQADAPLAEVLGLLATLSEAWAGVGAMTKPPETAKSAWVPPPMEPVAACEAHQWSF